MPSPTDLASQYVQLLKERTATNDADEVRQRFQAAYDVVEAAFRSDADRDPMFEAFADELDDPDLPIWEFSCLANTCGVAVEHGADPGYCLGPILDRLTEQLRGVPEMAEQLTALVGTNNLDAVPEEEWPALANRSPEAADRMRQFLGLGFNGRAAMAMLCRSAVLRQQARHRDDFVAAAVAGRQANPYAYFLSELLLAADGDDIIVIDLDSNRGVSVRLHAVRNNAHLFSLLQAALAEHPATAGWTDEKPSPLVTSLATGERMLDTVTPEEWHASGRVNDRGEAVDRAAFQFYQWMALRPDGTVETWEEAQPHQPWWVWAEFRPADIIELDGMKVILLTKPEMPRAWSVGFFAPIHPALRSRVEVRNALSAASVAGWLDRIRSMPREENPQPAASAEMVVAG